jgi:hypothetical protein
VEFQDPTNGEGSGGGSGGDGSGDGDDGPPPPSDACPSQDPECWQPLSSEQIELLNHIRLHEFVDSSSTTNPIARQHCREARQRLDQVMVIAGTQSSQLGSGRSDQEPPSQFHHGEYDPVRNRVHIDPMLFDSASSGPNRGLWRRALLAQVLHEISHLNPPSYGHPHADALRFAGAVPQNSAEVAVLYQQDLPYAVIHSQTPGAQCVKSF